MTEKIGGKKRGRKPITFTPEQREKVRLWAAVGTTHEVIASELGVCVETLVKNFADELAEASSRGVANVAATLYAKAMAGDTTSMIFYLKTRGRWREKASVGDEENPLVVKSDGEGATQLALQLAAALRDAKREADAKDIL